ncbi:acid protease [Hypoxylon sp. FL1857]|nr:acid protease [Hypoxylon sp. FL1857]
MHRALISLQLLLWVTGIHAFFHRLPRHRDASEHGGLEERDSTNKPNPQLGFVTFKLVPKPSNSKENLADKVSRAVNHLATKYGTKVPNRSTTNEDSALTNRDNDYTVVSAANPSASNAVGIDQDGTDYSYFIEANFGSEKKPMYMLVDTGASTTWVMGSGCTSSACTKHNTFGPNDSKTYNDTGSNYSVEYGSGDVSGHVVSDTISIAGLEVTMPFGVANVTSDQFSQFPFEGILGLSMTPNTWLTYVRDAKLIQANVFGVALSRNSDGANNGEIAFGAPNKAKFKGDVSYTPIQSGNSWAIPMDDVLYDGHSAGVKNRLAYIDTGTTFAFGPPEDVAALYKLVPNSKSTDNGQTYSVPCNSNASVSFSFSGQSWTASAKDFTSAPNSAGTCFGNIYGMEFVSGAWLLGDMFLKNVYTVFDVDQKRIGFAASAESGSGGTSPTATKSPNGSTTVAGSATSTATSNDSGVGLTPNGTPSADSSTSGAAAASTPSHESSGERLRGAGAYASLLCLVPIIGMII